MTKKEWNKLCEWAKKLNCDRVEVECDVEYDADIDTLDERVIYVNSVNNHFGYKTGLIIEQDGGIFSGKLCISENRPAKQIKAILKNLLNKN